MNIFPYLKIFFYQKSLIGVCSNITAEIILYLITDPRNANFLEIPDYIEETVNNVSTFTS